VTILIACGLTLTFVTLALVFGGFFAERRLRDRLEDIEMRARTGSRPPQMATLRRVDKAGRMPTLDKLLWRWFPNAGKVRRKLQASGMNLTLGDYAFLSIAIAVAVAFLLHLVLGLSPAITLGGTLATGIGLPNLWITRKAKKRALRFHLLFPEAIDLIVRALRAGLPVQEAIANVARDIKDPVGGIFRRAQQEMQLGAPIEAALWRVARTVLTDEFNFLIVAMSIQRDTGGNLAETLANPQFPVARSPAASPENPRLLFRSARDDADHDRPAVPGRWRPVPDFAEVHEPAVLHRDRPDGDRGRACSMGVGIFIMNKIATIKV